MSQILFIHFLLGMLASFIGTLPFGTINLSVVSTTVTHGFRAAIVVSVAVALVEILQSFIAFHFSVWIVENITHNLYLKLAVLFLFLAIGLYFLMRKATDGSASPNRFRLPNFLKGITLGLLNPQALPFWVFVIAYFQSTRLIALDGMDDDPLLLMSFLVGVSLGKLAALTLYAVLSVRMMKKIGAMGLWMNKILGALFLLLALVQAFRLF